MTKSSLGFFSELLPRCRVEELTSLSSLSLSLVHFTLSLNDYFLIYQSHGS